MENTAAPCSRTWSVVLAGGEGERVRPFVEKWLGHHRPKQYCTFVGTRSMFQHTLDRADMLTPSERRDHREEVCSQLRGRASDPDATVIIYPSDHFIYPEGRIMEFCCPSCCRGRKVSQPRNSSGGSAREPEPGIRLDGAGGGAERGKRSTAIGGVFHREAGPCGGQERNGARRLVEHLRYGGTS